MLRRQSLLGDAISHAALPGIALAFLLTGSKAPLVLVLGAAIAGWIGTLVVMTVTSRSRVTEDSSLGIVLSVFFGFGLVLLTMVQRMPDAGQAGLDRFLFGQAATLLARDVWIIAVLGGLALAVTALAWKEFKLLSFDPDFGSSLGLRMRAIDVLLTSVLVIAIVIGLQTVGVVLMSAMVVAPAAAARQWTDRLGTMVLIAGAFGALAGVSGAVISSTVSRVPTGPTIVLCLTAIVIVSLTLAPDGECSGSGRAGSAIGDGSAPARFWTTCTNSPAGTRHRTTRTRSQPSGRCAPGAWGSAARWTSCAAGVSLAGAARMAGVSRRKVAAPRRRGPNVLSLTATPTRRGSADGRPSSRSR